MSLVARIMRGEPPDTQWVDGLLIGEHNRLKVVPASVYQRLDPDTRQYWAFKHGYYGLPTVELVENLAHLFKRWPSSAWLEIGAGNGALGRALGIRSTDSFIQRRPDVALYYAAAMQPPVEYGDDVEQADALEAVRKYEPSVVIGQWVTQWIDPHKDPPPEGGSIYGVREPDVFADYPSVELYILLGRTSVHGHRPIIRNPPLGWAFHAEPDDVIWSRSAHDGTDQMYTWSRL